MDGNRGVLPRRFRSSAPGAPAVRVGLPSRSQASLGTVAAGLLACPQPARALRGIPANTRIGQEEPETLEVLRPACGGQGR